MASVGGRTEWPRRRVPLPAGGGAGLGLPERTVMSNTWRENAGLLVLRAGVGGVLVAHGVQKLFGWLGGHGLAGTGAAFEQMGFQPGRQAALAAGLGEAGGGVLIALGLATPAAGAAALLGVSAAALTLVGPGDWSLDARLGHRLNQPWLAAAAIIASSAVSLAIVHRRRQVLADRAAETTSQTPQGALADSAATAATEAS